MQPADLKPAPDNPRKHSAEQIQKLAKSMKAFGVVAPVIVDSQGQLIAGHARREAALVAGIDRMPVILADDLTAAQVKAYRIADNKLTEGSSWDEKLLAANLADLSKMQLDFELEDIGFVPAEIDVMTLDLETEVSTDKADEYSIHQGSGISKPGDLWLLGKHKVYCGDALDPASYEALLGEEKAAAAFTDPPYNVPIQGHVSGLGATKHREFLQASGELSREGFTHFLTTAFTRCREATVDGGLIYSFMDHRHLEEILAASAACGLTRNNLCVWTKNNGGMGSFYRSQHELVFVFQKPGAPSQNNVQLGRHGRNRTNVWAYPGASAFPRRGEENTLVYHPTPKPVTLVSDAILDCTQQGEIVLDPFLGSGTTILAAQRTKRRGYGIELDPLYVDTAIERWQRLTRSTATHASGATFAEISEERGGDEQG